MTREEAIRMSLREVFGRMAKGEVICNWIPCSERYPKCKWGEETEALLFQTNHGIIEVGYYGRGGKYRDQYFRPYRDTRDGYDAKDILAWTPLPEPYKEWK